MIRNINDVGLYTERLALDCPEIANEIVLKQKVTPSDDFSELEETIDLPPIYRSVARSWELADISLGLFSLTPGSSRHCDLAPAILNANSENWPSVSLARSRKMVIVAMEEANPICVGSASSNYPDKVFYIETRISPNLEIFQIAKDFEKFINLAASLHHIAYMNDLVITEKQGAMERACATFECSADEAQFWHMHLVELTM